MVLTVTGSERMPCWITVDVPDQKHQGYRQILDPVWGMVEEGAIKKMLLSWDTLT